MAVTINRFGIIWAMQRSQSGFPHLALDPLTSALSLPCLRERSVLLGLATREREA